MKSRLTLEFSGKMVGTLPERVTQAPDDPNYLRAESLIWESERLSTLVPYADRPKGSDRAICRTVNGTVQIKVNNKDIFKVLGNLERNMLTVGLYGESAGIIGAIEILQYKLTDFVQGVEYWPLNTYKSNGQLGGLLFSSHANLMQNIFIRVTITNPPGFVGGGNSVGIDCDCSGILVAADPR